MKFGMTYISSIGKEFTILDNVFVFLQNNLLYRKYFCSNIFYSIVHARNDNFHHLIRKNNTLSELKRNENLKNNPEKNYSKTS